MVIKLIANAVKAKERESRDILFRSCQSITLPIELQCRIKLIFALVLLMSWKIKINEDLKGEFLAHFFVEVHTGVSQRRDSAQYQPISCTAATATESQKPGLEKNASALNRIYADFSYQNKKWQCKNFHFTGFAGNCTS